MFVVSPPEANGVAELVPEKVKVHDPNLEVVVCMNVHIIYMCTLQHAYNILASKGFIIDKVGCCHLLEHSSPKKVSEPSLLLAPVPTV